MNAIAAFRLPRTPGCLRVGPFKGGCIEVPFMKLCGRDARASPFRDIAGANAGDGMLTGFKEDPSRGRWSPLPRALRGALLRERRGVRDPAVDPRAEPGCGGIPGGAHEEPARRSSAAREGERFRARLPEQGGGLVGLHAYDQVLIADADAHVSVEEESDPAEHLLLQDSGAAREHLADALGLRF